MTSKRGKLRRFGRARSAGAPGSGQRSERGVSIVEAAFVFPVFIALVLGVIEGGMYMQDYLGVSNAVRAGSRTASASGAVAEADLYTVYQVAKEATALNNDQIQYIVVYKASGFGAAPTDTGGPQGGCKSGIAVTGVCNVYRPADIQKAMEQMAEINAQEAAVAAGQNRTLDTSKIWFGCLTTGPNANNSPDRHWCPGTRNDARSDNNRSGPDYVGVYIKAQHTWVTRMFGTSSTITDQSVIQIEPREE